MLKEKKKKKEKEEILGNLKFLSFYLKANSATVSPPLSSVLGNLGLNTSNFCKEFNKLTEDLSNYLILKVYIKVDLNSRTWVIKLGEMPITYAYRIISLKTKKKYYGSGGFFFKEISYIKLLDFFLLFYFYNIKISEKEVKNKLSILKSMDIMVEIPTEQKTNWLKK